MRIPVPRESKSKIDKAGEILINANSTQTDVEWATELADRWRACHSYPINTFQATLRVNLGRMLPENDFIVAQRLKRMPTIISKLSHSPLMHLTTMQDIGGIRAVLPTIADVYRVADIYRTKKRFKHILVNSRDYIESPRDVDGYRSLHLIYKYQNSQAAEYNNLRIELQIRTKLQHTWATAVETMGTFLGQALKSRRGQADRDWLDFFALVASAFAYKEGTTRLPRFQNLSEAETARQLASLENRLNALEQMRGFSSAVNEIVGRGRNQQRTYHLLILDSLKKEVTITPYNRDSAQQAIDDYSKAEARVAKGEKIEPVLVSAGPLANIRRAYPSFFLDISEFSNQVSQIIRIGSGR